MRRVTQITLSGLVLLLTAMVWAENSGDNTRYWAQWRGPRMAGIAPHSNPPVKWSENENIHWKIQLPGLGSSTPIIWKDRLFILTAIPSEGEAKPPPPTGQRRDEKPKGQLSTRHPTANPEQIFTVFAISREDGSIIWQREANKTTPHEGKQPNNSFASGSAITDGEHLLAFFGSWGLYCYDMDGNLQWSRDLGDLNTRHGFGEGSTPALSGNKVVVNWDHEGQSFIVVLNKKTGEELWRRNRDEVTTWATPLVVRYEGRDQVITPGTNRVRSYDLESGDIIWEGAGLTVNTIPTPVEADGIVYVTSGYRGNAARAIRLADAIGDITNSSAVLWEIDRDTPYVPSPLLYDGYLYLIKGNNNILTTINASNGKVHYGPQRLEGLSEIYASPVGAAGRVYILGRDGKAIVLENTQTLTILAENSLDDGFDASPAIVDDQMYLRGYRHLYRISEE